MSDITSGTSGALCSNALVFYPIDSYIPGLPSTTGLITCIIAFIYVVMSLTTISWIKFQEFNARQADDHCQVRSVIFPVFVHVLWFSAFASIYSGLVIFFIPIDPVEENSWAYAVAYGLRRALQHAVIEGVAFLLMQNGLGMYTAKRVFTLIFMWSSFAFIVTVLLVSQETIGEIIEMAFDFVLLLFYLALWLAPYDKLYRRESAIRYAQGWSLYRLLVIGVNSLYFFESTEHLGSCIYIFLCLLAFAIFQPLSLYFVLLEDSKWWQGIYFSNSNNNSNNNDAGSSSANTPLLHGSDFSLASAQSLAYTLDHLRANTNIQMLNFAQVSIQLDQCLGTGSFSKVFAGSYRRVKCAVKVIISMDLTEAGIKKIAAEASILSSITNINVVSIVGVAVFPPSVCLLLELCVFGSLSDLIHGFGVGWSRNMRTPMTISKVDRLYLAWGCARGLAAVHDFSSTICHKDVKSFNFLVDSQLNAKIADLELGTFEGDMNSNTSTSTGEKIDELLLNWLAPEFIQGKNPYSQTCDVYSLAIVIWEIISCCFPFDDHDRSEIEEKLAHGYRHEIPDEYLGTNLANLIERGWDENPLRRPTAYQMASELEIIYKEFLRLDGVLTPEESSFQDIDIALNALTNEISSLIKSYLTFNRQTTILTEIADIQSLIQSGDCWKVFEESGQPWAVFLPTYPHILIYSTKAWRELTNFNPSDRVVQAQAANARTIITWDDICLDNRQIDELVALAIPDNGRVKIDGTFYHARETFLRNLIIEKSLEVRGHMHSHAGIVPVKRWPPAAASGITQNLPNPSAMLCSLHSFSVSNSCLVTLFNELNEQHVASGSLSRSSFGFGSRSLVPGEYGSSDGRSVLEALGKLFKGVRNGSDSLNGINNNNSHSNNSNKRSIGQKRFTTFKPEPSH